MSTMLERMENLADQEGIKLKQLAVKLGLSNSSFSDWKRGKASPSLNAVIKIAEYFDVSIDYLVYGAEFSSKAKLEFSSREDRDLLKKYHELPPDLQGKLLGYMDGLLSAVQQQVPGEEKLSV